MTLTLGRQRYNNYKVSFRPVWDTGVPVKKEKETEKEGQAGM